MLVMFRKQKQSLHPRRTSYLCSTYQAIKSGPRVRGGFKVGTDRLPVVQDTLDAGRDQQSRTPWVRWSFQCCLCASCQPLGNLLAGEIQRLDSKAAGPCSKNAPNPNAIDSARSVLAFPDFSLPAFSKYPQTKGVGFM
jgi:hypothetical protein